jgi:hypothetical protein
MVDVAAIAGALGSIKAAGEIANAMLKLHDARAIQEKTIELNRIILSAQQDALAANAAQMELVAQVRELEKEIDEMKDWKADKARYQLADIGKGVVALAIKETERCGEPFHRICADCAADGKKRYLQPVAQGPYYDEYACNGCNFKIGINKGTPPQSDWMPPGDDD